MVFSQNVLKLFNTRL